MNMAFDYAKSKATYVLSYMLFAGIPGKPCFTQKCSPFLRKWVGKIVILLILFVLTKTLAFR